MTVRDRERNTEKDRDRERCGNGDGERETESRRTLLTFMPSHRETARNGLKARRVRIERNAGTSSAPDQTAAKLISDS